MMMVDDKDDGDDDGGDGDDGELEHTDDADIGE